MEGTAKETDVLTSLETSKETEGPVPRKTVHVRDGLEPRVRTQEDEGPRE